MAYVVVAYVVVAYVVVAYVVMACVYSYGHDGIGQIIYTQMSTRV